MIIHELTRPECFELLQRVSEGRLACARHDQPYVVPVSLYFNTDDMALYGFSTVGQKIRWMRDNPKVCIEFDEITDRLHWTTVIITGVYDEIRNAPDAARLQDRALKVFQNRPQWWLPGTASISKKPGHDSPVVYRVRIDSISGRRTSRAPTPVGPTCRVCYRSSSENG